MADVDYDDEGWFDRPTEAHGGHGLRSLRLVNGAGALTSLALILGLGVWGYKLAVRDVNGVPVIRALAGPARVAPSDPGGELADHQGLAVNAIAAEGTATPPAERLALAPRPMELTDEDQPMTNVQIASVAGEPVAAGSAGGPATESPVPVPQPDIATANDGQTAALPGAADPIAAAVMESVAAIPADVPGVSRSPRPQERPAMLALAPEGATDPIAEAAAAAVAAALGGSIAAEASAEVAGDVAQASVPTLVQPTSAQVKPQVTDGGPVELAADRIPAGTRLAQLGAYQSVDEARSEWDQVMAALGPLMQGKKRVIETAQSGGRTFYRLRVQGFADLADARRFCAALKAEGRLCTPAQAQG